MVCPTMSSYLNYIENLFGYMSRKVYGDFTQYRTVA